MQSKYALFIISTPYFLGTLHNDSLDITAAVALSARHGISLKNILFPYRVSVITEVDTDRGYLPPCIPQNIRGHVFIAAGPIQYKSLTGSGHTISFQLS